MNPPLSAAMHHILVDYENVHHLDLTKVGDKPVSFVLLLGPKQHKVDAEMIAKLMAMASSVEMVRMASSGKNAVDFALAYYLGRAVLADPTGYFHIIAKDKGYDPLIAHLRERHVQVSRHESLSFEVPGKVPPVKKKAAVKKTAAKKAAKQAAKKVVKKAVTKKAAKKTTKKEASSAQTWTERVVKNFIDHPKALPAKKKTLLTKVGHLIKEPFDGPEVQSVIEKMQSAGMLKFNEKDVPKYNL